jgi:hypothetical protein
MAPEAHNLPVALLELSLVEDGVHASVLLLDFDLIALSAATSEIKHANSVTTLAEDLAILDDQVHFHGEILPVLLEHTSPHVVSFTRQHLLLVLVVNGDTAMFAPFTIHKRLVDATVTRLAGATAASA